MAASFTILIAFLFLKDVILMHPHHALVWTILTTLIMRHASLFQNNDFLCENN